MLNNFNDIFQKMQTMQQMSNGGQVGGQGLNNQALIQNLLANNPQLKQYQAMMNMANQGMPFPQQFNNQNNVQNAQNGNPNASKSNQNSTDTQANSNQNFNSAMPNFPNMNPSVDPMALINMMNNMQRQNVQTAPVRTGAVRRKSFGLSPIVGFANRDIIYSLTKFFAKK